MHCEQWRPVVGYLGLYEVSSEGRVRSCKRRLKPLAQVKNKRGYLQVNIYRDGQVRNFLVHRLVARSFIGEIPEGWQVNHKNGRKKDNRVENLELCTPEQNRKHAWELGLCRPKRGEANPKAKLTEDDVRAIRRLRAQGVTARKVGDKFGVTERTVYSIEHRRSWTHLDD
jgi:hypothetical protein